MIYINNISLDFRRHSSPQTIKGFLSEVLRKKSKSVSDKFRALDGIELQFNVGDRVGLIGRNGAGKSTLLKTIAGIYIPTRGDIKVEGKIVPLIEIGAGFNPEFSAIENIYLNGAIMGCKKSELNKIKEEIIEFSGLEEFMHTPVKYYSTGMYMKLAFSIATSIQPDILILDEIFAGGDSEFVKKAESRMAKIIHESNIMLMVSHDNNLIRKFCNRVIWMDHGKVVMDGSVDAVLSMYENDEQQ